MAHFVGRFHGQPSCYGEYNRIIVNGKVVKTRGNEVTIRRKISNGVYEIVNVVYTRKDKNLSGSIQAGVLVMVMGKLMPNNDISIDSKLVVLAYQIKVIDNIADDVRNSMLRLTGYITHLEPYNDGFNFIITQGRIRFEGWLTAMAKERYGDLILALTETTRVIIYSNYDSDTIYGKKVEILTNELAMSLK